MTTRALESLQNEGISLVFLGVLAPSRRHVKLAFHVQRSKSKPDHQNRPIRARFASSLRLSERPIPRRLARRPSPYPNWSSITDSMHSRHEHGERQSASRHFARRSTQLQKNRHGRNSLRRNGRAPIQTRRKLDRLI